MAPDPDALHDVAPVLALCPDVEPMAFCSLLPNDLVRHWLSAAMTPISAHWVTEFLPVPVSQSILPVIVEVTEADPVVKKARQSAKASGKGKALDKTPVGDR